MSILFNVLLFLHIVGAAMIVGYWIATMKQPTVHPRQRDGAFVQLITGIAMMGLLPVLHNQDPAEFGEPNYFKLGIKFAIGLAVAVMAVIGARKVKKGEPVSTGLAHGVGGLALLNIAIATIWQ
ncbi:membrane protein [Arthrobacter sp. MA-N2]|uniref:membrane protein n=1 Tax=Arthrobacter sp. MA-N2 TaxID=1101188 RepID=UPI00048794A5|nr:membrane protein [Arthrobacter sp. MA-N2]